MPLRIVVKGSGKRKTRTVVFDAEPIKISQAYWRKFSWTPTKDMARIQAAFIGVPLNRRIL